MVHIGDTPMSDTATAVALTEMNGRLNEIQQAIGHQLELMGRNREDAIRDVADCKKDITALEAEMVLTKARCEALEKLEEQRKGATRLLTIIVGVTGTLLGLAISLVTKLI